MFPSLSPGACAAVGRILLTTLLATPITVWIDALLDRSPLANTFAISAALRFGVIAISYWVVVSLFRRWNR